MERRLSFDTMVVP